MRQDRRNFIATVGATLAAAALPLPLPAHRAVTVMGIGGLGVSVANQLARERFPAAYWVWDSEPPEGGPSAVTSRIAPEVIHDPRAKIVLSRAVAQELDRHQRWLRRDVILIAGLGGLTGSFVTPPIARLLDERACKVSLVVPARVQRAAVPWRPGLFGWALDEAECVRTRTTILSTGLAFRRALAAAGGDLPRARRAFRRWMVQELGILVRSTVQRVTGRHV